MFDFCGQNLKSRIFLAPLAGFTDAGFRALCAENGAGLTYTEMVSAKGMCYGNPGTEALLYRDASDCDCAVQLFGSEPEFMFRAAGDARLSPFGIVDINMGCPVKKVFSNGDGSALMLRPELICDVVRAAAEGSGKPVTVKLRAGVRADTPLAAECALAAVRGGARAVTVHPRFREQMYGGRADHSLTAEVARAVDVPMVASGDITDGESFWRIRRESRADAFMIGRGALGRPWIFRVLDRLDRLSDGDVFADGGTGATREDALRYAEELSAEARDDFDAYAAVQRHVDILLRVLPERSVANSMKLHLCHYAKNTRGAKAVRLAIASVHDVSDVLAVAREHLSR